MRQPCNFSVADGRWVCSVCGRSVPASGSRPPIAVCRGRGLGDMVKSTLSAVGITEERVSKAIGRPCGCGKRAAAMNAFGAKYLGLPPGGQDGKSDSSNVPS